MNKAVIIDRDGTLNVEKNYLYRIEDFEFTYKAPEAIKLLNENGFKVIVITNQAGVGRGYYTEDDVKKLHRCVSNKLNKVGASIEEFYYCPHHPTAGLNEYKVQCDCRKPNSMLYEKAISKYDIDVTKSYIIGDKNSDLEPGKKMNMKSILVLTGYGEDEKDKNNVYYDIVKDNLFQAVEFIIEENKRG